MYYLICSFTLPVVFLGLVCLVRLRYIDFFSFYTENSTDIKGRYLSDILSFSDDELERTHNYIQWLFPLDEPSKYNVMCPLISRKATRHFFLNNEIASGNMLKSFIRMLDFYGFSYDCDNKTVSISSSFSYKSVNWLTSRNHNYLRITRILKSLVLCGFYDEAIAFYKALQGIYKDYSSVIGESFDYWTSALLESRYTSSYAQTDR